MLTSHHFVYETQKKIFMTYTVEVLKIRSKFINLRTVSLVFQLHDLCRLGQTFLEYDITASINKSTMENS